jgi:hypothetical protein
MSPARLAGALVVVAVLVLTSGCGGRQTPGDAVPAMKGALVQVDEALVAHQWPLARQTLHSVLQQAATARRTGTITPSEAARVRAAATRLLSRLPR